MSFNRVITNFDALLNNVILDDSEIQNSICIDTSNNRLGIKVADPQYELDISGNVQFGRLYLLNKKEIDIMNNNSDINYDFSYLVLSNGLYVKTDLIIDASLTSLNITCMSGNIMDISSYNILNKNKISSQRIDTSYIYVENIDISGDISNGGTSFVASNFTCNGDIICGEISATKYNNTSDDRIKHNEVDISNGLKLIRSLKPQLYQKTLKPKTINYNGPLNENYTIEAGLIAQDILKINDLSFCVNINDENIYTLDYNSIFVYSIQAIKDLDKLTNITLKKNILELSNNIINSNKLLNDISFNIIENNNRIIELDSNINNLKSNEGLANISRILSNQNQLINNLTNKILVLENKIKDL